MFSFYFALCTEQAVSPNSHCDYQIGSPSVTITDHSQTTLGFIIMNLIYLSSALIMVDLMLQVFL